MPQLIRAAEEPDDFTDLAMVGERRNSQHVRQHELRVAVLGIFFEQLFEDLPGFRANTCRKNPACSASGAALARGVCAAAR